MRRALLEFKIVGVSTNIPFHLQVMNNPHFMAGRLDTTFLEKHFRLDRHDPLKDEKIALVAAAALTYHRRREAPKAAPPVAPCSPSAWRSQGRPNGSWGRTVWRKDT
jgi:pyruvate carboxylase